MIILCLCVVCILFCTCTSTVLQSLAIFQSVSCKYLAVFSDITGAGRFGKDVSAKKVRDVSANFSCRNIPYYFGPVLSWFCFWFSTNWLGPVCRILELKKTDKTINVGMMESIKRASDMSQFL